MASYEELKGLQKDSGLQDKVEVAGWVWAQAVLTELAATPDHDKRVSMARRIFANPLPLSKDLMSAVLAANKGAGVGAITGASDAQIQTAVDDVLDAYAVDLLVAGTV